MLSAVLVVTVLVAGVAEQSFPHAENSGVSHPSSRSKINSIVKLSTSGEGLSIEKHAVSNGKEGHPVPYKMPQWAKDFNRDLNKLTSNKTKSITKLSTSGHSGSIEKHAVTDGNEVHPAPPKMPKWAKDFNRDLNKLTNNKTKTITKLSTSGQGGTIEKHAVSEGKQVHPAPPKMPKWAKDFNRDLNKLTNNKTKTITKLSTSDHGGSIEKHAISDGKEVHPAPPRMPQWAKDFNRDLNKLTNNKTKTITKLSIAGHSVQIEKHAVATGKEVYPVPPQMPQWAKNFNRDLNKITNNKTNVLNKITNNKTDVSLVDVAGVKSLPESAAPSKGKAMTLSISPSKPTPLHFMMKSAADSCKCEFKDICSCYSTMEFMECISSSCASGLCDCPVDLYQHACSSVAGSCASLDFKCTTKRAVCLSDSESELVKSMEASKPDPPKPVEEIHAALLSLKERKCRLELELAEGYVNVETKLADVAHKIGNHMDDLVERSEKQPEMHCEKHFEEWTVPKSLQKQQSSAFHSAVAGGLPLLLTTALALVNAII